jgi:hypothetical protein
MPCERRPPTERPRLRLLEFRPIIKGALRGFATVDLPPGLIISDIGVFCGPNGTWANLPTRPVLDASGQHKLGANGRKEYAPVMRWRNKDLAHRFSDSLTALIIAVHGAGALDGGGE